MHEGKAEEDEEKEHHRMRGEGTFVITFPERTRAYYRLER